MSEFDRTIVNPDIESYLKDLFPPRDPILEEMERHGEETGFPIVGPLVGRLLWQLAAAVGARRVFELGSGFGYSALWFARAVGEGGEVVFTDLSGDNAALARDYFHRAGLAQRIRIVCGDALEALDREEGPFDVIFNDVDKEFYPRTVKRACDKLRSGGLFITDNALWYGRVLTRDPSESTAGVREFTRLLLEEKSFLTNILPLRDGISVSLKR